MRKFYKYLLLPSGKAHYKITKKFTIDKYCWIGNILFDFVLSIERWFEMFHMAKNAKIV